MEHNERSIEQKIERIERIVGDLRTVQWDLRNETSVEDINKLYYFVLLCVEKGV